MRRLLVLLIPLVLSAQVEIDTVIRFPAVLGNGIFIPELNKLYINSNYRIFVLDCSTYQLKAEIPTAGTAGYANFAWNWRRQKLYFTSLAYPHQTLMAIDAVADTVVRILPFLGWPVYVSSTDRIYPGGGDSTPVIDCATDSVVRKIPSPVPGYGFVTPSWDSVGDKLFVSLSPFQGPGLIAVYDCSYDSLLAVIDLQGLCGPGLMHFNYHYGKAYFAPICYLGALLCPGVIDINNNTFIKRFPISIEEGEFNPVAVDTIDNKVYISEVCPHGSRTPETLFVIDCATDSIIRRVLYRGTTRFGALVVRWVPWSNRVYFAGETIGDTLWVLDCRTDSIIARLQLGQAGPADIQLDPIRQRIFVIGADTMSVHVLRDVVSGVAEPAAPISAVSTLRLWPNPAQDWLWLDGTESPMLYSVCGRKVMALVPGRNDLQTLTSGVYFVRTRSGTTSQKVVIRR